MRFHCAVIGRHIKYTKPCFCQFLERSNKTKDVFTQFMQFGKFAILLKWDLAKDILNTFEFFGFHDYL